jgi:hypothetical protein
VGWICAGAARIWILFIKNRIDLLSRSGDCDDYFLTMLRQEMV